MPKIISRTELIQKLIDIHNGKYDYSLLPETFKTADEITIICPIHGHYQQRYNVHARGNKCPKCNWDNKRQQTQKKWIKQSKIVHNDFYDYTKVVYTSPNEYVEIICPKHGSFNMTLHNHAMGKQKCPLCGSGKKRTTKDFIILAKEVHGNKYDYTKSKYTKANSKLIITCPKHGDFEQTPDAHCLSSNAGCPSCKNSKGENKILDILKKFNITDFICQKTFDNLVNPATGLKLKYDFYIPSFNLIIEYDGEQHFHKVNYSGQLTEQYMEERLNSIQRLDTIKTQYAHDNNINLLRIKFDQFNHIESIISCYISAYQYST